MDLKNGPNIYKWLLPLLSVAQIMVSQMIRHSSVRNDLRAVDPFFHREQQRSGGIGLVQQRLHQSHSRNRHGRVGACAIGHGHQSPGIWQGREIQIGGGGLEGLREGALCAGRAAQEADVVGRGGEVAVRDAAAEGAAEGVRRGARRVQAGRHRPLLRR